MLEFYHLFNWICFSIEFMFFLPLKYSQKFLIWADTDIPQAFLTVRGSTTDSCGEWLQIEAWLIMQTVQWGSQGFSGLKVTFTMLFMEELLVLYNFLITVALKGLTGTHWNKDSKLKCEKRRGEYDPRYYGGANMSPSHTRLLVPRDFFVFFCENNQDWTGCSCIEGWNVQLIQQWEPGDVIGLYDCC